MLNIQLMSDLHFEFHPDGGAQWVEQLDAAGVDILILAGDIAEVKRGLLAQILKQFCLKYPQVVFVPGNHEYYGSSIEEVSQTLIQLNQTISNLHILQGDTTIISGQRFVGATLWFTEKKDENHQIWTQMLNDFRKIAGGFSSWVYQQAEQDAQYLIDQVEPGDIVITHHIPSRRGVAPKWQASIDEFGRFFVHELPEEVVTKAAIWCHGHGHDSVSSTIEGHTLVSNPFGYLNHEENKAFNSKLVFKV